MRFSWLCALPSRRLLAYGEGMLESVNPADYEALTGDAGFGLLMRSRVALSGRDRATLLHKFCTQDVIGKQPGEGGEAFLCNVQGKIVGYAYFFVEEERIILDSAPGQSAPLIQHLDRYVITEDVQFQDLTSDIATFLLCGHQVGSRLGGVPVPQAMYAHQSVSLGGIDAVIARVPFAGEASWLLTARRQDADAVAKELRERGIGESSAEAAEVVRVEHGTPLYGTDITVENLPQEVARDAVAIHFRKGCYLGQETVARIDALGHVNKLLMGLRFDAGSSVQPGQELKVGEKTVAKVTSCVYSPRFQAPLALAFVRREHATPGTRIENAEVVRLTFP